MHPRRRILLAVGASAFVLVALAGVVLRGPSATDAADLTMSSLEGNGTIALSDYRGRPVVLNFFASWCTFCIAEMPDFEKVHASMGDRVAFLGVATQDSRQQALTLAKLTRVTYPLANDPSGDLFERLEGRGMPTTIFIAPDGKIVERFTGPLSERALRDRISKHFSV